MIWYHHVIFLWLMQICCGLIVHSYPEKSLEEIHRKIIAVKKREVERVIRNTIGFGSTHKFHHEHHKIFKEGKSKLDDLRHKRYIVKKKSRSKRDLESAEAKILMVSPQSKKPIIDDRVWFDVSDLNGYEIENANIVYKYERSKQNLDSNQTRIIFYLFNSFNENDYEQHFISEQKNKMENGNDLWESFDVTELVQTWSINPDSNFGMKIVITNNKNKKDENIFDDGKLGIFLEISNALPKKKSKRMLKNDDKIFSDKCLISDTSANRTCCRYPFEIHFDNHEWDWIIAPKNMTLYYCAGVCTQAVQHLSAHTFLLKTGHFRTDQCCIPVDTNPITIMYNDFDGNYQVKSVPDLFVSRCRCK